MSFATVDRPRPHVSVITLDRPERMNAMSFATSRTATSSSSA
jgi:enoyl-CoA hydratase